MSDIIFELTNEQRRYFCLPPIRKSWKRMEVKQKTYDPCRTFIYLNGSVIRRVIQVSDESGFATYREFSVDLSVSEDGKYLISGASGTKKRRLTVYELEQTPPVGMALDFKAPYVYICNADADMDYYSSAHEGYELNSLESFKSWVSSWCEESTEEDLKDIRRFSRRKSTVHEYKEGDIFRFKLGRRAYGYGRIVLDARNIISSGKPYWNFLEEKHLYASVYHAVSEGKDISARDLDGKMTMPPHLMTNGKFLNGEYEIIGNLPATDESDLPIHYGEIWDKKEFRHTLYQRGHEFITVEYDDPVEEGYANRYAGDSVHVTLPILKRCILDNSNGAFWQMWNGGAAGADLRHPALSDTRIRVLKHVGVIYDEKIAEARRKNPRPNLKSKIVRVKYKRKIY